MRRRKGLLCGLMCVVVALMLAIARGDTAVADTTVSGYISADTTWTAANSPYSVTGNVIVRSSATLTIEPGVTVNFNADKALQIDGGLIAKGTSASPITFTGGNDASTGVTAKWAYILFSDSSTDAAYSSTGDYASGSILEYCTVEYAGGTSVSDNGAIRLNNAHPFINYCTIQNNSAPGIYAYNISGTLKIKNNTITDNTSSSRSTYTGGAGISVSHSSGGATTISGNTIKDNTAYYVGGGGIYTNEGTVTLTNNTISGNAASLPSGGSTAPSGGGIFLRGGTVTLTNNTISSNTASSGVGGGIYTTSGTVTLTNNTISSNTSSGKGGGVYNTSKMTLTNNTIISNTSSESGGGIYTSSGTITNNTISDNTASSDGGGIYTYAETPTLTNNTISSNTASSGNGGGIYISKTATLTNNTISGNTAKNAAAVYYGSGDGKGFKYNTITGNKATDGQNTYAVYVNAYPIINYNNVYDNTATYELWFNKSQGSANLDAKNNWWGSSDDSTVQGKIYDGIDDSAKALVDYYPYSTAIRTDTGATGTTTPTPTPTATASPTPSPTPQSSPTPVASPSPKPSPSPAASPKPTLPPTPTPVASPSPAPTLPPSPTPQVSPSPIPEGMVFGIVMDENGDSLRGVTVTIANGKTQSTETDEYGYYEFSGLEAGEYTLTFEKSGYTNWTLDITLKAEEILEAETITMELEVKGSIYGYVVDIQGNPIESVKLKLKGLKTKIKKNASSDKDGFFEFADLEKDKYIIFASKKRYKKAQQTVNLDEGDDQEIEIEMRKSSRSRTVIPEAEE